MICATPTLIQLVDLYSRHHPSLDSASLKLYGYAVGSLEKHYGYSLRACDFSEDLILPWLSARLAQRSAKTVKRERGDLLTLWRFAFKRGLCRESPFDIPAVKVPMRTPNSWTPGEYAMIVDSCRKLTGTVKGTAIPRSLWWHTITTFLYWVGCRIGAAVAIEPSDVNLSRRTVRLRSDAAKTDFEQVLALHPMACQSIEEMMAFRQPHVWPTGVSHRRLWEQYKVILTSAGLPHDRSCMFQRTRRTTYTLCVKFGSKELASKQLGHKTDMSRFYLDTTQLGQQSAADVMPSF